MFAEILKNGYFLPAWLGITLSIPLVGVATYFIILFVKDKFGSK
jgi:hypothetical protein